MFDIGTGELLTLAIVALLVFGPERLPEMAAKAGRLVRQLRSMADGAKSELSEQLGPEFSNLNLSDLQPRNLVRKHLLDGLDDGGELRKAVDPRALLREIDNAGRARPAARSANGSPGPDSHSANPPSETSTPRSPVAPAPFDTDAT